MAKKKQDTDKLKGMYNNPNREMSIEDMIRLKHSGDKEVDKFLRGFRVSDNPCPNHKLRPKNARCFYCILDCWIPALEEIKEYKNYYKVKNKKYPKEEFDDKSN